MTFVVRAEESEQLPRGLVMIIDEIVQDKQVGSEVDIGGMSVPVAALAALREEGYQYLRPYGSEKTISAWGKTCSGCFTQSHLRRMAR